MPPQTHSEKITREDGTASVELIAAIPILLLAFLVAAQIAVAGYALWSAGVAARAGARQALIGGDVVAAARGALPPSVRDGAKVDASELSVRVAVPRLLPALPKVIVGARTQLGPSGG